MIVFKTRRSAAAVAIKDVIRHIAFRCFDVESSDTIFILLLGGGMVLLMMISGGLILTRSPISFVFGLACFSPWHNVTVCVQIYVGHRMNDQ